MSHIVSIEMNILDLAALAEACEHLSLEFKHGQKTYNWFGRSVGDYPLPAGFTKAELGTCEHAISVKGNKQAYEIGVVQRRDGKAGFTLLYDYFAGGYGLIDKVGGNECGGLLQEYAAAVAIKQCKRQGMQVMRQQSTDGKIRLVAKA